MAPPIKLIAEPTTATAATITTERDLLAEILARTNEIALQQSRPVPIQLKTWEDIERFAEKAARSGMVPKDYVEKPDAICIAVQLGSELGLPPMQSLTNIAVINGRPAVWGDAMPALCRASGKVRHIREWSDGKGDALTYWCEAARKDDPNAVVQGFSVAQAKQAGLWKEGPKTIKTGRNGSYETDSGPWWYYPERMLQMRARGFALRDAFPDVLRGLISAEEAADMPPLEPVTMPPPRAVAKVQPADPPKRTRAQFLDQLQSDLTEALAQPEPRPLVDAILGHADVKRAEDTFTDGHKQRLEAIIQTAISQLAEPETEQQAEEF